MALVRSMGNKSTEQALMDQIRAVGITGWRRKWDLLGKPDLVFPMARVAVFVDGCFWHGCPKHRRIPKTNVLYWLAKIHRNIERDKEVTASLRAKGWFVVRVWEHEIRHGVALKKILRKMRNISG